ncbi:16119_t:CDS:2 [Rhizophagus irregularis]|nr:16119_t:CDS:2 [Rhizophagus irregularis]
MTPYKPMERSRHTATLIDDKLYILGGYKPLEVGKDFFYLDVSVPFITRNLLWKDLSSINTVPSHYHAVSVNGGENNNSLFLYGGYVDVTVTDFVYIFNPKSNSWSIPQIIDNIPPKLNGNISMKKNVLTGIIDRNGKMYLWGGLVLGKNTHFFNNDMLILDTKKLIWELGSSFDAPTARMNYGATLLPDNRIIYMSGFNGDVLTLNQTTSGIVPSGRNGFSAVLGSDGQRVIIYGGAPALNQKFTPENSLYELNVINFEWHIPKISGIIPKSRAYHSANVIGKYMVITFGEGYDRFTESDILLLDISNVDEYIWTYEFYPPPLPQSSTSSGSLIGGATLSSVEIEQIQNEFITNHEPISTPDSIINNCSNHGQESIPIVDDNRLTLHELKQEIQDLRQIIIQSNKQSTNPIK